MQLPQSIIQSLVLFFYMGVGFACAKTNILNQEMSRGISRLLLNVTLPALVFISMLRAYDPALLPQIALLIGISFAVYGACIGLAFLFFIIFKIDGRKAGVFRFGIVFSNVGFMGYPVMEAIFGKESLFPTAIYNIAFQVLTFSVGILMLRPRADGPKKNPLLLLLNVNILAALLGLGFFFCRLSLPVPLHQALSRLGDATTPLSMIFIGATLARSSFKSIALNPGVWLVSAFRAVILPAALFFILRPIAALIAFPIEVPVMIAAMPVAANAAILAEENGADTETASGLIAFSTLICMLTIPVISKLFFGK
jgi:malate permease and related proteins